jgi:hypothetical protein
MAVAGASRYTNAAILANRQGFSAQAPNLISNLGTVDILDIGRSASRIKGVGLSGNARALNKQFLQSSTSLFNSVFSLNVSETSSVEALQKQVAALRSKLPVNKLSKDLQEQITEQAAKNAKARGSVVNTEA